MFFLYENVSSYRNQLLSIPALIIMFQVSMAIAWKSNTFVPSPVCNICVISLWYNNNLTSVEHFDINCKSSILLCMARGTINILQNAWILAHINLFLYVDNSQPSALGIWLECQNINIKAITEYVNSDLHVKEKT